MNELLTIEELKTYDAVAIGPLGELWKKLDDGPMWSPGGVMLLHEGGLLARLNAASKWSAYKKVQEVSK